MYEVLIKPAALTEAAKYLMHLQGDAIWERMPRKEQERCKQQVITTLNLCGLTLPGASG